MTCEGVLFTEAERQAKVTHSRNLHERKEKGTEVPLQQEQKNRRVCVEVAASAVRNRGAAVRRWSGRYNLRTR